MVQITSVVLFLSSLASFVSATPVPHKSSAVAPAAAPTAATLVAASTGNAPAAVGDGFQLLKHADFQISGGVAGNAAAEANAISSLAERHGGMRKAAEAAETGEFNPAIVAAFGAEATALQVGKIKNKVLKLTAFCQVLNIKIAKAKAAGNDSADLEAKLVSQQTKLNNNIATDRKSAGAVSQAIV
ncbi:hypothetical protein D9615_007754 [Tricholomella constricta]|uniref:Small secreted protein n=1 Tax=Tricholomella constricta TaxID=117010 RepID=A0A8H5H3H8_9AGAR|nr:hypothetical protein D9615_007754 [Tricholomella constricta]